MLSIERVVTFLAPFFAAGAAVIVGLLGKAVGIHLDPGALAGLMSAAFVATIGLVAKWLHGRQIPAIAGITISQTEVDKIHEETAAYLQAHAPETKVNEDAVVEAVLSRLRQQLSITPAPPAAQ